MIILHLNHLKTYSWKGFESRGNQTLFYLSIERFSDEEISHLLPFKRWLFSMFSNGDIMKFLKHSFCFMAVK